MSLENWTDELTVSMIPEGMLQDIAKTIGVDNLLKLSALLGGTTFYLAQKNKILRPLRDHKILEEYNGYNTMELSKKYNVTPRWVKQLYCRNQKDN